MKKALSVLLALLALFWAAGAPAQEAEIPKRSMSFFGTFDTIIIIQGYAADDATFANVTGRAQAMFERYDAVFDAYTSHEGVQNLYALNRDAPAGEAVPVERELMDLLLFCKAYQPQTHGRFNVAMGSVLSVWHDYREAGIGDPENAELPPTKLLQATAQHTNFDDVLLDEQACTVTFLDPDLRLDVGAVAKGYATEQVAQWMLRSEMPSFLISAGGNIRIGDGPLDGRQRWGASIQDPDGSIFGDPNEDVLDVLFLKGGSVVTSGDYQRFYVVDGKRYHHLIDPGTLMPADYARSVTIVCEDSGLADLLSTAVFLMPYDEGAAFVASLDGVECLWMLQDGSVHLSEGMYAISRDYGTGSSRD